MDSILFSTKLRHLTDKESHIFCDREEAEYLLWWKKSQTENQRIRGKWQIDFRLKDSCKLLQASLRHAPSFLGSIHIHKEIISQKQSKIPALQGLLTPASYNQGKTFKL